MTVASLLGILVFLFGVPAVTAALFALPQYRSWFLAVMVFTTCYIKKPFYQEVFFVDYRGVDRGFGVTIPDLFFFGFFLWLLLGGSGRRIIWLPYNSISWFLLILVSAASLVGSAEPLLGAFTVHKFVRAWVLYMVMVNVVNQRRDVLIVLVAAASAIVFQGLVVVWDKYVTGAVVHRAIGTFRHPNTLAMYVNMVLPVLLAGLLASPLTRFVRGLFIGALVLGLLSVIFTRSRAAMLLLPSALAAVALISIIMRPSVRKFGMVSAGAIALLILIVMALPQLIRRFETAPKESAETRVYFNEAAAAMARDNLLGIGVNLYSYALANTEYYWHVYPDFVHVADPEAFRQSPHGKSRLGTAHHIYWLHASETGYIGAAVFVLHIGLFWAYGLVAFVREKGQLFKSIFLGLLVATAVTHAHGLLEWVFRQTEVLYLYFILMGTMVSMVRMSSRDGPANGTVGRESGRRLPPVSVVKRRLRHASLDHREVVQ